MDDDRSFLQRLGPGAIVVLVAFGIFAMAAHFLTMGGETPMKRVTETVTIKIVQPPPPPPPPPKIEHPPEPTPIRQAEIKPEKVPDKPKEPPKPENNPPPGPLGLDAKGEGAGDAFGLAGRPGGTGLIGGGGGGSNFGWYASMLQTQVEQLLHKNAKLAHGQYRLVYKLWISPAGKLERIELVSSTGDAEVDALVKETLANMPALQAPPKDMPQPVVLGTSALRQG